MDIGELTKEIENPGAYDWGGKKPASVDSLMRIPDVKLLKVNDKEDKYIIWRKVEPVAWIDMTGVSYQIVL